MQIQINTDHNIHGYESVAAAVRASVEDALSRFSAQITRVEVHVGDENAAKHGRDDKRCMMEVRLQGHQPVAVTHHADTVTQAIDGAASRMVHLLEHTFGRLRDHRVRTPIPGELDDPAPPAT